MPLNLGRKENEAILITCPDGQRIELRVSKIIERDRHRDSKVHISVDAPPNYKIDREEMFLEQRRNDGTSKETRPAGSEQQPAVVKYRSSLAGARERAERMGPNPGHPHATLRPIGNGKDNLLGNVPRADPGADVQRG